MEDVSAWLDRYLEIRHLEMAAGANPDGPEMGTLLDGFSPEGRYCDMPSGGVWQGRDELREMFILNYAWASDQVINFKRRMIDGRQYALEGEATGTNGTPLGERGRPYALQFACLGVFDDEGRVLEQRDYWDTKSWRVQIGADEPG
jgi:hypothetical protein